MDYNLENNYCAAQKFLIMKICTKCNVTYNLNEFNKNKTKSDGLANTCKTCCKNYRLDNINKAKLYSEVNQYKYKGLYSDKLQHYQRGRSGSEFYQKTRGAKLKSDPVYALKCRLRGRAARIFKIKKFVKSTTLYEYLGCSPIEAKDYLTSLFTEGMSWENRSEWHIDHIVPLSSALTPDDLIKLFHYTNLQPLWALDNLKKGCRL